MDSHPTVSHAEAATVQLCVRFPRDQYDALVAIADREERSISQVIRRAARVAIGAGRDKDGVALP